MKIIPNLIGGVLLALLAACATTPPVATEKPPAEVASAKTVKLLWQPLAWSEFGEWQSFDLRAGGNALRTSCKVMARKTGWREACDGLAGIAANDDAALRQYLQNRFRPYRLIGSDGADSGLVTGYY